MTGLGLGHLTRSLQEFLTLIWNRNHLKKQKYSVGSHFLSVTLCVWRKIFKKSVRLMPEFSEGNQNVCRHNLVQLTDLPLSNYLSLHSPFLTSFAFNCLRIKLTVICFKEIQTFPLRNK